MTDLLYERMKKRLSMAVLQPQPSLFQRARALFTPSLVGGMDQTTLALGADFSHWSGDVPASFFSELDWISTKALDGNQIYAGSSADLTNYVDKTFHTNVQKAYDAGKPMIPYIYMQWMTNQNNDYCAKRHYELFKWATRSLVPGVSFHAVAIDIEERGETSTNAKDKVMALYNLLSNDPALKGMPVIFYTSMNVLSWYPALSDWLSFQGANRNLWLAQWAHYTGTQTTWTEVKNKYIPALNMKVTTPGYATWRMVQWAGDWAKIDGQPAMDLNFYKGTKAQMYEWLNFQPATSTPPEEPPQEPPTEPPADTGQYVTRAEFDALKLALENHTHTYALTGSTSGPHTAAG